MTDEPGTGETFKRCTMCAHLWQARSDFLGDPDVALVGYQAWAPEPALGLLLFNHEQCHTTLAIEARLFEDLYDGPVYETAKHGTDECFGFCDFEDHLEDRCPNECECAWVREVLQVVRLWPKDP